MPGASFRRHAFQFGVGVDDRTHVGGFLESGQHGVEDFGCDAPVEIVSMPGLVWSG